MQQQKTQCLPTYPTSTSALRTILDNLNVIDKKLNKLDDQEKSYIDLPSSYPSLVSSFGVEKSLDGQDEEEEEPQDMGGLLQIMVKKINGNEKS